MKRGRSSHGKDCGHRVSQSAAGKCTDSKGMSALPPEPHLLIHPLQSSGSPAIADHCRAWSGAQELLPFQLGCTHPVEQGGSEELPYHQSGQVPLQLARWRAALEPTCDGTDASAPPRQQSPLASWHLHLRQLHPMLSPHGPSELANLVAGTEVEPSAPSQVGVLSEHELQQPEAGPPTALKLSKLSFLSLLHEFLSRAMLRQHPSLWLQILQKKAEVWICLAMQGWAFPHLLAAQPPECPEIVRLLAGGADSDRFCC
mmetsp:Transcript_35836/g.65075  ORF Transcript_35836/g.65075 Transcript_35836/m.65075 type:complete len:258 (+) Transcript_35836:173-946(+)